VTDTIRSLAAAEVAKLPPLCRAIMEWRKGYPRRCNQPGAMTGKGVVRCDGCARAGR
jgi:hypothetical protein